MRDCLVPVALPSPVLYAALHLRSVLSPPRSALYLSIYLSIYLSPYLYPTLCPALLHISSLPCSSLRIEKSRLSRCNLDSPKDDDSRRTGFVVSERRTRSSDVSSARAALPMMSPGQEQSGRNLASPTAKAGPGSPNPGSSNVDGAMVWTGGGGAKVSPA